MHIIAHRGLINGPDKDKENSPTQIDQALSLGFDAEIDLWVVNDKFFLGHDEPQYEISQEYLNNDKFWIHAKNLAALEWLTKNGEHLNFFWHDVDAYIITSKKYIWTVNQEEYTDNTVIVIPEYPRTDKEFSCFGICCDYAGEILA